MRREELYLTDISEAAEAMASFLSGVARADSLQDDLRRSAVLHKLTIIGEAAARLPEDSRARHSVLWTWAKGGDDYLISA